MNSESTRKILIFKGKVRDMTWQAITVAWLRHTRPVEPLEAEDFSKN